MDQLYTLLQVIMPAEEAALFTWLIFTVGGGVLIGSLMGFVMNADLGENSRDE